MNNKLIAYNDTEGLKIIHPSESFPGELIADKDVPSGLMYKFIDASDLPSREFRNFWTMEITNENKDGIGLTKEEFVKKYPEYKDWAVQ